MFQFAAGRALALSRRTNLKVDVADLSRYTRHQGFQMADIFEGNFGVANRNDMKEVLGWRSPALVRYALSKPMLHGLRGSRYVIERHFQYWAEVKHLPADAYMAGYWQSPKYFEEHESVIRADFSFRRPLSERNALLADEIGQSNALSLHVRRGDYVTDPSAAATHGVCSVAYYQAAVNYVAETIGPAVYFIFSDDIEWVRMNLQIDAPCVYLDHNKGPESYNDMRLMSLCKHHIIANSTFSWWGAWLNPSAEKVVVAPRKWFANGVVPESLYPHGWIVL